MAKLQLTNTQSHTINTVKDKLESALADGVENPANTPAVDSVIKAMQGYKTPISPEATLTDDDKDTIKGSYMSTFAALLSALGGSSWSVPSYSAGWSAWNDANYQDMQYKKDGMGIVSIRGLTRKAATVVSQSTVFTLPVGFRPSRGLIVAGVSNDSPCEFRVEANGEVRAVIGDFGAVANWWSLIVSFEAA